MFHRFTTRLHVASTDVSVLVSSDSSEAPCNDALRSSRDPVSHFRPVARIQRRRWRVFGRPLNYFVADTLTKNGQSARESIYTASLLHGRNSTVVTRRNRAEGRSMDLRGCEYRDQVEETFRHGINFLSMAHRNSVASPDVTKPSNERDDFTVRVLNVACCPALSLNQGANLYCLSLNRSETILLLIVAFWRIKGYSVCRSVGQLHMVMLTIVVLMFRLRGY